MVARIYSPSRSVMQAGRAKTGKWVLEYIPDSAKSIDPLMGWSGGNDMRRHIRLTFSSLEQAENYAKSNGIPYRVEKSTPTRRKRRSYRDNFSWSRPTQWTH